MTDPKAPILYLVDVSNYLFRSYYALPPMSTPAGEPISAVFGLLRALLNIKIGLGAEHLLAVFDGKEGKARRKTIYEAYKSNRSVAPEDLIKQIPIAKQMCEALGISYICEDEYEADDLISAAAHQSRSFGYLCMICSSDKDLLQLVDGTICCLQTHKNNLKLGPKEVEDIYGIKPKQIPDYLALCGDASDNIPGVAGIGPKTAVSLLKKYNNIEGIIAHLDELGEKRAASFNVELARLSYRLAILEDVPSWKLDIQKASWRLPKPEISIKWLEKKGFHSLLKPFEQILKMQDQQPGVNVNPSYQEARIVNEGSKSSCGSSKNSQLDLFADLSLKNKTSLPACQEIITWNKLAQMLEHKVDGEIFVEVVFSKEKVFLEKRPLLFIFAWMGRSYLISGSLQDQEKEKLKQALRKQSFWSYDISEVERCWLNWSLQGPFHFCYDLKLASHLHFADGRELSSGSLLSGFSIVSFSDWQACQELFENEQIPLEEKAEKIQLRIEAWQGLRDQLDQFLSPDLKDLLNKIELPFSSILARMQHVGVFVDESKLKSLSLYLHRSIKSLETRIFELFGSKFNLNSPKQLARQLFEVLKLRVIKENKSGPSTDAATLEELKGEHPVIEQILHYRELEKLRSTYADSLPGYINPTTGCIHPHFEQTGTSTGRLSCREPNLQNIPIRNQEGLKIREAFCVRDEHNVMIGADYSQIELRMMAHLSEDESLIEAFIRGDDIHRYTASLVFGLKQEEVTEQQRSLAKAVNFGVMYGQQAFGLSKQLGISVKEASCFIEAYFKRYPKVASYIVKCKAQAIETGFVTTLLGRRRNIPEIKSPKAAIRALGERLSVNTPVQGGGADLIKLAMLAIDPKLKKFNAHMILQIHDELIFECPQDKQEHFLEMVKQEMEGVVQLKVPLIVNTSVGKNWREC